MKFNRNYSLADGPAKDPQPIVTMKLRGGNESRNTLFCGLTFLWDSGAFIRITRKKHIKPYESKLISNKVKYSTYTDLYWTIHDTKFHFSMQYFSSRKLPQTVSTFIMSKTSHALDIT